jgi:signal transduction histidine kinase/CheY-like chemotaxis protein/CHASE3 domain sensor protein
MNLNIRNKLLLGFAIISLKMIAISVFVLNEFSAYNERITYLSDSTMTRIEMANQVMVGILQVTRFEKNIIIIDDSLQINDHRIQLRRYIDELNRSILQFRIIALRQDVLDEIEKNWINYQRALERIINHASIGQSQIAFQISDNEARTSRDTMIVLSENLIALNKSLLEKSVAQSQNALSTALTVFVILILVSIVLVSLISIWIVRGIGNRIAFISREADKIARRETEEMREDEVNDELKPVSDSLLRISNSFKEITENANAVALGEYNTEIIPLSKKDSLGIALNKMTDSLRKITAENEKHNWLISGQNKINQKIRGDKDISVLGEEILAFLVPYVKANLGAIFILKEEENEYHLRAKYAIPDSLAAQEKFAPGEGITGQIAIDAKTKILNNLKKEHFRVVSATLDATPDSLAIIPFVVENKVIGIMEIGKIEPFASAEIELLESLSETLGISLNSAISRKKINNLLEETQLQSEELQAQSEELQSQSEELSQANVELEEQAQQLKHQQEELKTSNDELQEQTQELEEKNAELEKVRKAIEEKSRQVELSSKYKSEFLANMSHELRTPLNSLLILAKDLANNNSQNLTDDQIESAEIIYRSGKDLLILINEVLDLAKIEAGKMTLNPTEVKISEMGENIRQKFKKQVEQKGLNFNINIANDAPEYIITDYQRLEQILKNLLSNAIKFTEKGSISILFSKHSKEKISIKIEDTGIGIPKDKQDIIFEAFQQAEGGTSRKYGGTGLGLSISKELAHLLGGTITLESKEEDGSAFTLIIPQQLKVEEKEVKKELESKKTSSNKSEFLNYPTIEDDRNNISEEDRVVLIIEDDRNFSSVLKKQVNERKFQCISAATGEDGLVLAEKFKPDAIILDITLPGMDGNAVLSELKANPDLRHIPVHVVSGKEKEMGIIRSGAIEYLTKPVTKEQLNQVFNKIEDLLERIPKNLLIIEDDKNLRHAMKKLIGDHVNFLEAATGNEALKILKKEYVDCIILDLGLPDMSGFELIKKMEEFENFQIPPIIVNTGRELTKEENDELESLTKSIIIKGVKSDERLLDETALFLHHTISKLTPEKQEMISGLYDKEAVFKDKKILVVDDDMRNVFALSKVLKDRGMIIIKAENGIRAIEKLKANKDTALVLMDIMMPEMDGYETMREIRKMDEFRNLPIIALTAKAMKEDRQKTIDAGANDYIPKPVELDRLFSLMRIWLSKK